MEALTRRQCTGTNRAGEQCRRAPIPGGSVCAVHGGKAPQVMEAAKRRLLVGRDLAVDALLAALSSEAPPCPACGRSDTDRDPAVIRAAQIVLDRAGFGPTSTLLSVHSSGDAAYVQWMTSEELVLLNSMFIEAKRRMEAGEPLPEHRSQASLGPALPVEEGVCVEVEPVEEPRMSEETGEC